MMTDAGGKPNPKFRFENDLTGQLFCWLVVSGRVDWRAMIDPALCEDAGQRKAVKRLAHALEDAILQFPDWHSQPLETAAGAEGTPVPKYMIWFRPSPSKKIRFREIAHALLTYVDRLPPDEAQPYWM